MEAIFKRDRLLVIAALAGITLLAWGYMVHEARGMNLTGVCCCAGMKMAGPDMNPWSTATLPPLFLMWSEMMVAMISALVLLEKVAPKSWQAGRFAGAAFVVWGSWMIATRTGS